MSPVRIDDSPYGYTPHNAKKTCTMAKGIRKAKIYITSFFFPQKLISSQLSDFTVIIASVTLLSKTGYVL